MSNFEVPSPILSSPVEEPKEHWWLIAFPGDGLRDAWGVKGKS